MLSLFGWATAVVLYGLLVPSALQAQYPRARRGQFEVQGFDFRWLREGAVGALNLASPAPGGGKVVGRVIVPVLPIAFRNVAPPFPPARYQELIFNPAPVGRAGTIARVHIADVTQASHYSATVNQVAARSTYAPRDPGGYSITLAP